MTEQEFKEKILDCEYVASHKFELLAELNRQLSVNIDIGRDLLIRLLERREAFQGYEAMLSALLEKAGLYPYLEDRELEELTGAELIAYECHRPQNLGNIILHSEQMAIYQRLLSGENIILSAPTSFGKSLLIDAMIASKKFKKIVVIVPTIALIDETRKRLVEKFSNEYVVITHPPALDFEKVIYILTQERFLEFRGVLSPDFFIVDEFYKLNSPIADNGRAISLNKAFLNLCHTGAQFLLIGPNIQGVHSGTSKIKYSFIRTDFRTVSTDVIFVPCHNQTLEGCCINTAKELRDSTLIFCKSRNSAYTLAERMIANNLGCSNQEVVELAAWLRDNFHESWDFPRFIENGIGVHHASLPRSLSSYVLSLFNSKKIKYLLCTSTIIEGVNTSAKNIIIYDNKIANKKFDYFTFNNIKGRAGRMFQYFVGRVFVLSSPPEEELPLVEIPALSLPESVPVQVVLDISDESGLSDKTIEQLRFLHSQPYLDFGVLQQNPSVCPYQMVRVAEKITKNISQYAKILKWNGYPTGEELDTVCRLIFSEFSERDDVVRTARQLTFKIWQLKQHMPDGIKKLIAEQVAKKEFYQTPTIAVESTFSFLRQWAEFHFPRFLLALNDIQQHVLTKFNLQAGDYTLFADEVKRWFLPPAATVLEEYGIPLQVTRKIESVVPLGASPAEILKTLKGVDFSKISLSELERRFLANVLGENNSYSWNP